MNVSLTPKLEEYIRNKVAGGMYNNASEVIREALRLAIEQDAASLNVRPVETKTAVVKRLAKMEPTLRKRGVTSLALFGAVRRGEIGRDKDIDVFVEHDTASRLDLMDIVEFESTFKVDLGREVNVKTRENIDSDMLDGVLAEAEWIF